MLRTVGALTAIGLAAIVSPATAADVTAERLLNSPNDPQNWLMVHRDYDNSRHSGLKEINSTNAKDLKLKFMISIGGMATGGTLRGKEEATPLVDDPPTVAGSCRMRRSPRVVRHQGGPWPLWPAWSRRSSVFPHRWPGRRPNIRSPCVPAG